MEYQRSALNSFLLLCNTLAFGYVVDNRIDAALLAATYCEVHQGAASLPGKMRPKRYSPQKGLLTKKNV